MPDDMIAPAIPDISEQQLSMDDGSVMPITGPTMGDVIAARFGRRDMMKGLLAATAITAIAVLVRRH